MARDLIPCEVHTPTPEQIQFAASVAVGSDERFRASYSRAERTVTVEAVGLDPLPRNLFLSRERCELNQQRPARSAVLWGVEVGQWWEASWAALAELQLTDDWVDHGCADPRGRYEITTPQGSVSTGNQAVAVTLHSALQQVGARPRLRDRGAPDPRDGIDRIEGARVFVEVDGCQVPMSASDAGRV